MTVASGRIAGGRVAGGSIASGRVAQAVAVTSSVTFTAPSSPVYTLCQDNGLRGMVGSPLARTWLAFSQGGTRYVPHCSQGGSMADPTDYTDLAGATGDLTGATAVEVPLGSVSRTGAEVATITQTALEGAGVTGITRDGATLTIAGASDIVIPPDVDTTDTSQRGMRGMIRCDWGDRGGDQNSTGGTNTTCIMHLGQVGAALSRGGRILALGCWGAGGYGGAGTGPRVAAWTGGAYNTDPGALTLLAEGLIADALVTGPSVNEAGTLSFLPIEAARFGASDDVWLGCFGTAGGIQFRAHGRTPEGRGSFATAQAMMVDNARAASMATPYTSYTPTVVQTLNVGYFGIHGPCFAIIEFPDDDGNFPANGGWAIEYGDHNPDRTRGTQVTASTAILDVEWTGLRSSYSSSWTEISLVSQRRHFNSADPVNEAYGASVYTWTDLNIPSTDPAVLVADLGAQDVGDNESVTNTFSTPVAVGSEVLGAGTYWALGTNYGRPDQTPATTITLDVFLESVAYSAFWLQGAWEDDPELWVDKVRGARNRGAAAGGGSYLPNSDAVEYRARSIVGSTMEMTPGQPVPSSFPTNANDDTPLACEAGNVFTMTRTGWTTS